MIKALRIAEKIPAYGMYEFSDEIHWKREQSAAYKYEERIEVLIPGRNQPLVVFISL